MIRVVNQEAPRVKKAKLQSLTRELELLIMKDDESAVDFAGKLSRIVNQKRGLGKNLEEESVVAKPLRSVPAKFDPIVTTMEQFVSMKIELENAKCNEVIWYCLVNSLQRSGRWSFIWEENI